MEHRSIWWGNWLRIDDFWAHSPAGRFGRANNTGATPWCLGKPTGAKVICSLELCSQEWFQFAENCLAYFSEETVSRYIFVGLQSHPVLVSELVAITLMDGDWHGFHSEEICGEAIFKHFPSGTHTEQKKTHPVSTVSSSSLLELLVKASRTRASPSGLVLRCKRMDFFIWKRSVHHPLWSSSEAWISWRLHILFLRSIYME